MQDKWAGGQFCHGSWSDPIDWSSDKFTYFEDCEAWSDGTGGSGLFYNGFTDAFCGARVIARKCHFHHMWLATHGTDTTGSGAPQGSRPGIVAYGQFNNHFYDMTKGGSAGAITDMRSGVQYAYGNRVHQLTSANGSNVGYPQKTYRSYVDATGTTRHYGEANGESRYDKNDQTSFGNPVVYFTGKAFANSTPGGQMVIQIALSDGVTRPNWNFSANNGRGQWYGYVLVNTSTNAPNTTETTISTSSAIQSNTASSLTIKSSAGFTKISDITFTKGDNVEIRRVLVAADGCGVHGGGMWTGQGPNYTVPFQAGNSDQVITPCYFWNNAIINDTNGNLTPIHPSDGGMALSIEGIHYIDQSGPPPGFTELAYPHPLISGVAPPPLTPRITSDAGVTFYTDPVSQNFQVTVIDFSNTPGISYAVVSKPTGANWPPNNVIANASGLISGTAVGAIVGLYTVDITATNAAPTPDEVATQRFALNIATNQPPAKPAITAPSPGQNFAAPADITITATATDPDGLITKVEFYKGTTLIDTKTAPVSPGGTSYQTVWAGVAA
jgi:hypothetical protein